MLTEISNVQDLYTYLNQLNPTKPADQLVIRFLECILKCVNDSGYILIEKVETIFYEFEHIDRTKELSVRFDITKERVFTKLKELGVLYTVIRRENQQFVRYIAFQKPIHEQLAADGFISLKQQLKACVSRNATAMQASPILDISGTFIQVNGKKRFTPLGRLNNRIENRIKSVKYLGDIPINDEEFILLKQALKEYWATICFGEAKYISPLLAVGLVQIGIRHYTQGNYWGNFLSAIEMQHQKNPIYQSRFGRMFSDTISFYQRVTLEGNENVSKILLHGYVCDYYANNYFDFLFKFYELDLDRDIGRLDYDALSALIDTITNKSTVGRAYMLVRQTCDAVVLNPRGAKVRIRRHLKLIDKIFFNGDIELLSVNRINRYLLKWASESEVFREIAEKFGGSSNSKQKRNSSPYLVFDQSTNEFLINLPAQLLRIEMPEPLYWEVQCNSQIIKVPIELGEGVTGYKTFSESIKIERSDLLNKFIVSIHGENGDYTKHFPTINALDVRFFDETGVQVTSRALQTGIAYGFSYVSDIIYSSALKASYVDNGLLVSIFDFSFADILRLPSKQIVVIGKRAIEEGLVGKGILENAYARFEGRRIPLFQNIPYVVLKMATSKANGTCISINGRRSRLIDANVVTFSLEDRSNEVGYYVNLAELSCSSDGYYSIEVDIPSDALKKWDFVYIEDIEPEFDGAPYIFEPRGTIHLPDRLNLAHDRSCCSKDSSGNIYKFEINPLCDELTFTTDLSGALVDLCFTIPALFWRFDATGWHHEQPAELWYSDFPAIVDLKIPHYKLVMYMDENGAEDSMVEQQDLNFKKNNSADFISCDITKFHSYLKGGSALRTLWLDFHDQHIAFIKVLTESIVISCNLLGDYHNSLLIVEANIIGKANYVADVYLGECVIADKLPLLNGKLSVQTDLQSATYQIALFEDRTDESGFSFESYQQIGIFQQALVNPYDMRGKSFQILYMQKGINSQFRTPLYMRFFIEKLHLALNVNDPMIYDGEMVVLKTGDEFIQAAYPVRVQFCDIEDLRHVSLSFMEDDSPLSFLFDSERHIIVKYEDPSIHTYDRYRRFIELSEDDVFAIQFVETVHVIPKGTPDTIPYREKKLEFHWSTNETASENQSVQPSLLQRRLAFGAHIPIESFNLNYVALHALRSARLYNAKMIYDFGYDGLRDLQHLGKDGLDEIIEQLDKLGLNLLNSTSMDD